MLRKFDDQTGTEIPDGTGIEVTFSVAGDRRVQHFTDWNSVPFKKLVTLAQAQGALLFVVLRDMAQTTATGSPAGASVGAGAAP